MTSKNISIKGIKQPFREGTIVSAATGSAVSFAELFDDLQKVRIIYLGEKHSDPVHHKIQLKIINELYQTNKNIIVGMEMFDTTYQPVLDQWSDGKLDREAFLERTHWYANWKMDYTLYEGILDFVKEKRIKLIGLNIPFYIPPKIAVGGIDSLSPIEKSYLPETIDLGNEDHKDYVRTIFTLHHVRGMDDFENFYAAQCVWEDAMAEAVARHTNGRVIVVIAGNGHIIKKFGVPDRAFKRSAAPFKTVYLAHPGDEIERAFGDYIWITPLETSNQ